MAEELGTGQSRLLEVSCGVAQHKGTSHHYAKDLLKQYALSRKDAFKKSIYGEWSGAHAFVIFVALEGLVPDFKAYIRKHKLGHCVISNVARNPNHSGWYAATQDSKVGAKLFVICYQPDHVALTEWYQDNFDKDYTLP